MRVLVVVTVGVLCTGACSRTAPPPAVHAAKAAANRARNEENLLRPCARSSAAYRGAKQAFARIDAAISALDPNDDPRPVMDALSELSRSQCFEMGGGITFDEPVEEAIKWYSFPDSGAALKALWESGGRDYMQGYLELASPHSTPHFLWSEPEFLRTLSTETRPASSLAPLLCELNDTACTNETIAWKTRALARFRVEAERDRLDELREHADDEALDFFECENAALTAPARKRFTRWVDCLGKFTNETLDFPLGGIQGPARGWLVVSGRRGHYDFCDELRAYDVEHGSAYVAQSCSELALVEGGSVDHRATDRKRAQRAKAGKVSVDNLREAVWYLLVAPELRIVPHPVGHAVPDGLELVYELHDDSASMWESEVWSSDQSRVAWGYLLDGKLLASGVLTWPGNTGRIEDDYAVELLDIAELSFREGCAPRSLPGEVIRFDPSLGAHRLDADSTSLETAAGKLGAAWIDLTRRTPCRGVR